MLRQCPTQLYLGYTLHVREKLCILSAMPTLSSIKIYSATSCLLQQGTGK